VKRRNLEFRECASQPKAHETTVYFWERHHLPRNLLGRAGWINKFRLALIEHDLELYLSHHDE